VTTSHGSNTDVLANGYVLSEFLKSMSFSGERDAAESTTFKKKSKVYTPGLKDSSMSCEGVYDGEADAVDEVLNAALLTSLTGLVSYIPQGREVVGNRVYSLDFIESSYEVNTEIGDVAQVSAEFTAGDSGRFTRGFVARPYGVAAAPGNSAPIDGGAATNAGASLVVHTTVSANLVLKLQDSADGVTFADLAGSLTFANGRGSKRLVVPGTIRRYTRVLWTGTGTFLAAIDRLN
jgi:hypothetical protein